nr:MAG TPA: hypothetical protein [Caudoviricetes sp.]DAK00631.1 MAG TPA: hypothetical protein [Caudoviricetes sp.]
MYKEKVGISNAITDLLLSFYFLIVDVKEQIEKNSK